MGNLLQVEELQIELITAAGVIRAVDGVSFCIGSGETVTIIGESNIPSLLPLNASELYGKNIAEFLKHLTTKDGFKWEMDEEITKGSLIVHKGAAVHPSASKSVNA